MSTLQTTILKHPDSGTNNIQFSSSGQVGMGTSSPHVASQLHVSGSNYNPIYVDTSNSGGGGAAFRHDGTQALYVGTGGSSWLTGSATTDALIRAKENLVFATNGNNRQMDIDTSGRVLVGLSSARTNYYGSLASDLQVQNSGFAAISCHATNGNGALILGRDNVVNGSALGNLTWQANTGSQMEQACAITASVVGVPTASNVPGRIQFLTRNTTDASSQVRMTLGADGNLGMATTTTNWFSGSNRLVVRNNSSAGSSSCVLALQDQGGHYPFVAWNSAASGTRGLILFRTSGAGGVVGSITTDGSSTTYAPSSDYRLKENVVPLTNAIARLDQLNPYRYNFISTPEIVRDGFLAHEVSPVVPDAVVGEKDAVDENGDIVGQGLDVTKLIPLLTAALQEAVSKIETLEVKVAALEAG